MKGKILAMGALLWLNGAVYAVDCSVKRTGQSVTTASSFCITTSTYANDGVLHAAAESWNSRCNAGIDTPWINVGGCQSGDIRITVRYIEGISENSLQSCADFQPPPAGAMTGGTIRLWQFQIYNGVPTACSQSNPTDSLTHELGHVLGLKDVGAPECNGHIMGNRTMGQMRTIFTDDCAQVDMMWNTEHEQVDFCNQHCWTGCDGATCPPQPVTTLPNPCPYSPIIIDLDDDGYHLVGLADAVMFDIDADGNPDRISWTAASTADAFLVMDRNGNGTIDDGRELFGNATMMASGLTAPNGYEPLIEFDQPELGGNGDSLITFADSVWSRLQVWIDKDHDAYSDPNELKSLAAVGITEFDTKYRRAHMSDDFGNQFRFKSKVMVKNKKGKEKPETTYDVFFVLGNP